MKKGRLALICLASLLCVPGCANNNSGSTEPEQKTEIKLDKATAQLTVGDTLTLSVSGILGATFVWSSSNEEVVTVKDGVLTAVGAGSAVITVKVSGQEDLSASCSVTVQEAVKSYYIQEPTEIQIKTTFNDTYGQILIDAANSLMKKEPKLTITYEKYQGGYSDLKNDIVNGVPVDNYPDIAAAYPDSVADFINANVQLDMEQFMYDEEVGWTDEEFEDYYEAYLDEGRNYSVPGTFSLPIAKSTEAMYYDGDKILGITLEGVNGGQAITEEYINSLTWDELFDVFCPALLKYRESLLTDAAKKAFLDTETYSDWAVVGYDSDDNLFITLAEQYGYGYTSINQNTGKGVIDFVNDGMKGLMKKFNSAYKNKYFTTKGIIGTNVNYRSNEDAMLFSIGSTGGVNYQFSAQNPKNVKVARIPQAPDKAPKLIQQGPSLAFLSHNDDNRALATWLYYKELTTVNRCTAWSTTTGYSPIRKSVSESDEFLEYIDESNYKEKTVDLLKAHNASYAVDISDYLFSSPVFKGSSEARTQVGGLATKAIGADALTDETLDTLFQTAYENTVLKM